MGFLRQHRTIPALRLKHRSGSCGTASALPKAQIILDAAKVSAASGGNSEPKQGQRSQSARGFCPRSTMRVLQPDIIEHLATQMAVPERAVLAARRNCGVAQEIPIKCKSRAVKSSAFAFYGDFLGNTAQFPPYGLSTAPAAAARHLRCQKRR